MKRLVIIILSVLCILFMSTAALANIIEIKNYADLLLNTTKEETSLTLREGEYSITSAVDITGQEYKSLIINNAYTSLMTDSTGKSAKLFVLDSLTLGENGGSITAIGGSNGSRDAYGISAGSLTQSGGNITATGGSNGSRNAYGIYATNLTQSGGNITATGGSGEYAYGISAGSLTQSGGNITATGGSNGSRNAYGIYAGSLTQSGGNISATGGSAPSAYGIFINSNIVQEEGNIIAYGGSVASVYGINVFGAFTQNGGNIIAYGGNESIQTAYGIFTTKLIQDGGSISANGGSEKSNRAYGIYTNNLMQSEGSISANGGKGDSAYGIYAGSLTQHGGSITTSGGSGEYAYGIYATNLTQSGGSISAISGAGTDAYGLWVYGYSKISNLIIIAREGETASVYVNCFGNDVFFAMLEGSTLVPIVDLSKPDTLASGLVISQYKTNIEDNVTLAPTMQNTYKLLKDEYMTVMFLKSEESFINGDFMDPEETITLYYDIEKGNGEKEYYLTITRDNTPKEIFEKKGADKNYVNLVDKLYNFLTGNEIASSKYFELIKMLDDIDNSKSVEEAILTINDVIDSLENKVSAQLSWSHANIRSFNNAQLSFSSKLDMSSDVKKIMFWYDVSFIFGKRYEDKEFIREYLYGLATAGKYLGFAAQIQIWDGNIAEPSNFVFRPMLWNENASEYKDYSNGRGFGLTSLVSYNFNTSKLFDPEIGFMFGYIGNQITGGMKQNSVRLSLNLNNMFNITDIIGIEANTGLKYTSNSFETYENSKYIYDNYNSLSLSLGANLTFDVSNSFKANIHTYMDVELLDNNNFEKNVNNGELKAVALALNEYNRVSFGVGAKIMYIVSDSLGIDLGYGLYINKPYVSNQIKVGLSLQF